jgi:hypothetical protein
VAALLTQFPLTADLEAWYARAGLVAVGLVVLLTVSSARAAVGGARGATLDSVGRYTRATG